MDCNETNSLFNHRMVTHTPRSYWLNSQKVLESWRGLCNPCHAHNEKGVMIMMMMVMKIFIPQESFFFPKDSQSFLKVKFTLGYLKRSYQNLKVPIISSYIWNHMPLLYIIWVLHYTPHFCFREKGSRIHWATEKAYKDTPTCTSGHWISRSYHVSTTASMWMVVTCASTRPHTGSKKDSVTALQWSQPSQTRAVS